MITYELTRADLLAWATWRSAQTAVDDPQRRRGRVVATWVVGAGCYTVIAACLTVPWLLARQFALAGIAELAAVVAGVFGAWLEWRMGTTARWLERRRASLRARVALEQTGSSRQIGLVADGVQIGAGDQTTLLPWNAVTDVIETQHHLFIRTGPKTAHVVPRTEAVDASELASQIRSHLDPTP